MFWRSASSFDVPGAGCAEPAVVTFGADAHATIIPVSASIGSSCTRFIRAPPENHVTPYDTSSCVAIHIPAHPGGEDLGRSSIQIPTALDSENARALLI